MKTFLLILFSLALAGTSAAQTNPPPTPTPLALAGWNVAINGSFSTATGSTNNGFALTEALRASEYFNIRADEYFLYSPDVTVTLAGIEGRLPGTKIFKTTNFAANASRMEFFGNVEIGTAHSTIFATQKITDRKFAWGVGGGLDVCVSSTVCIRPLDVKWVNGGTLTQGGHLLGNQWNFEAGLGLRFVLEPEWTTNQRHSFLQ